MKDGGGRAAGDQDVLEFEFELCRLHNAAAVHAPHL